MLSLLFLAPVVLAVQNSTFTALADEYWAQQMRLSPLTATFYGVRGYDDKLDDNTAAGRADEVKTLTALRSKLAAIDPAALDEQEKVSAELLQNLIDLALERHKHRFWEFDVDHMDGPQSWIPSVVEVAQPLGNEAEAEAMLRRMAAMPAYFDNHIANLREGLAKDRTAAAVAVEKTIRQLDELSTQLPKDSPYNLAAKARLPKDINDKYSQKARFAVQRYVWPAMKTYRDFLRDEYLPKARREKVGLSAVKGGDDAYRYLIKYHTTIDASPKQLHRMGEDELERIQEEMRAIAKGDPKEYFNKLRADPKNFFTTREEVLAEAERLVAKAKAKLPEAFGILPKTDLVVKPVEGYKEKNETAARYYPPPDDLSRPGIYYINTYKPESRARYTMTSLAVHEGVPGHHLQIAIAAEQRGLPAFRRQGQFTAYVEGWALYSERLAGELGLYEDDASKMGMLSDQAWRACRLVVDTGIHSLGWSRQKAVDFMLANTARSREEVEVEIDRYIIWPGQALAYMVGKNEIMSIREEAKKKPGFDLRKFHDAVLAPGALPLPILRRLVLKP